ncbi:MAG: hypothetical protein JO188_19060 [Hyphomicrobiales bacterium]|nr:hypothetical protein [Hyphomicrobiales bacterium]
MSLVQKVRTVPLPLEQLTYARPQTLAQALDVDVQMIRRFLRANPEIEVLVPGGQCYSINAPQFLVAWRSKRKPFGSAPANSALSRWHAEQRARKEQLQAATA